MPDTDIQWVGHHLEIEPSRRPKKLTGTRFAAVLGLSPWATPFQTWCAVTRTYEEPFEDTIYTAAGKIIEPKQAEFMKKTYFMDTLQTPTDVWGEDYFKKTYGDFFPQEKTLGGMWDYRLLDEKGRPKAVLEMKTSKRVEDWKDDVPEYYALQAALYAWLMRVDQVYMVASFLQQDDYAHPETFVPSVKNTIVRPFKVSERYPAFDRYVEAALDWWKTYVVSGISPDFDEKKDADILKALRTQTAPLSGEDIQRMIAEAEALQQKIDGITKDAAPLEKTLKDLTAKIKAYMQQSFTQDTKYVDLDSGPKVWTLTRSIQTKVDEQRLKEDGLFDKYAKQTESYRLTIKDKKQEEK